MNNRYIIRLAIAILVLVTTISVSSCSKEDGYPDIPASGEQDASSCIIENYSITVSNENVTRATVDNDLKATLQEGDRLWCVARDTHGILAGLGYLTMKSGAGKNTATFSGQFAYKNGATITEYNYMLLSSNTEAYEIKTVADRSITWVTPEVRQWPFPTDNPLPAKICPDLQDAVERFGVFSCKVEAEELPKNISLAQEKSFIVFNLAIDNNTGFTAGRSMELSCKFQADTPRMFPSYTTTVSQDKKASFVLPMESTFSKAQIIIPRADVSALAVKFGKAENTLDPGKVYHVSKTVTNDNLLQLTNDLPTGFIGMCISDVEGIIVDLGNRGRIVVDTKNLGAVKPDAPGDMCGFAATYDDSNGWKALDNADFNALLALDHTWNEDRGGGVEFHFALQGFHTTTTLFLPAAGYEQDGTIQSRGTLGFYWTSSFTDWEKVDAFVMEFGQNGYQSVTSTTTTAVYSVRRYHTIDDL